MSDAYLIWARSDNDETHWFVLADDLSDLAEKVRRRLFDGFSPFTAEQPPVDVLVFRADAAARIVPDAATDRAQIQTTRQYALPSIADLPAFTATTVVQANTALQAIRTSFNTLLAELRAGGLMQG